MIIRGLFSILFVLPGLGVLVRKSGGYYITDASSAEFP